MSARVQKWGNSLAVRIPKAFAAEAGLAADSLVDIRVEEGRVVLVPVPPRRYSLDNLLADITDDNQHQEVAFGSRMGSEAW
jgi:antitoxin MazE